MRFFLTLILLVAVADTTLADKKKTKDTPAKKVSVQVKSWKEVEKLVQQQKKKVVVLNIWTSTCGTCKDEFPHFVKLQKQFGTKKLACISVNCDYDGIEGKPPKFYEPTVVKFLKEQKATFTNVMLDRAFLDFLEDVELSTTPAFYVYSSDGKLAKRFDNDDVEKIEDEFKFSDVQELVAKLVKTKK